MRIDEQAFGEWPRNNLATTTHVNTEPLDQGGYLVPFELIPLITNMTLDDDGATLNIHYDLVARKEPQRDKVDWRKEGF